MKGSVDGTDSTAGTPGARRIVVECKVRYKGFEQTLCMRNWCRLVPTWTVTRLESYLVIFDRAEDKPWEATAYRRDIAGGGSKVTVWGM